MNRTLSLIIFISVAISIYGLMNFYFIRKHKNVITLKALPKILLRLVAATIILAPVATIIFSANEIPILAAASGFVGYAWLAFLFLFLVIHGIADIILFTIERIGKRPPPHAAKWLFGITVSLNAFILIYGAYDARRIRVERVTFETAKLPSESTPIRIAQISDVHFSSLTGKAAALRIEALILEIKPDIIVCTGDLLDRGVKEPEAVKDVLRRLPAPMGKFAIVGNHEYFYGIDKSKAFIEDAGFTYLRNSSTTVDGKLAIVGLDDPTAKRFKLTTGRSEKDVLSPMDQNLYTIVLKHQPRVDKTLTQYYDLMLSGHTHAGQIFPFAIAVKLVFPYFSGRYDIDETTQIYVNRGTGTWGPPFRFLAPPEMTLITLKPLQK